MKNKGTWIGFCCVLFILGSSSWSAEESEPAYCDPARFDEFEISLDTKVEDKSQHSKLSRAHAFRLGKTTLIGLGVGNTPVEETIKLNKKFLGEKGSPNYCTWYLNHPKKPGDLNKKLAGETFVHRNVPVNPMFQTEEEASTSFMKILTTSFDQDAVSFASCASEHHYIALGCNEMMHRGPTVFGMLLAFSGCNPSHALEIVDQAWGLNHVKRKVRLAVIEKAYELGKSRPEGRKRLSQALLSN